jgi:TRAP-type C4-dicarboxylate transport system permease small subunit
MNQDSKNTDSSGSSWLLKNPLEGTLCLLLIGIVLLTFIEVLFRNVFKWSLAWTEELAIFLFVWLAALASAYAFKLGTHFAIRFLVNRLGKETQKSIGFVVMLIISLFLILFTWKAVEYTIRMSGQIAPSTGLSMAVPYSSAIVGGLLMLYYVIKNWLRDLRQPQQEEDQDR